MNIKNKIAAAVLVVSAVIGTSVTASAAGFNICYDGGVHFYTGEVYSLLVNGNKINSPMEPIIFNDRALVPVREIFEECGAKVDYTNETQCVEIQYDKSYIRMYINDNYAYVNGKKEIIPGDVVPKLINKPGGDTKTMVPVRFISETVGMDVDFNAPQGEILITSQEAKATPEPTAVPTPEPTPQPTAVPTVAPTAAPTPKPLAVTDIKYKMISDTSVKITAKCDGDVSGKFSYFTLSSPERAVLDFKGAVLAKGAQTINIGVPGINDIRTASNDARARIVVDVENLVSVSAEKSGDNEVELIIKVSGKTLEISKPQSTPAPTATPKPSSSVSGGESSVTDVVSSAAKADKRKVIMLDAGHGGSDPGAIGTLDGKTINEKDLTLAITYKVKNILESRGYVTSMTRTGDTLPSLSERPQMANEQGCSLFVSIHINSASTPDAYGMEVYYTPSNNNDDYGVTSSQLAKYVHDGIIDNTGAYDRGVKTANWAVTRLSQMPAILVEVGFISNTEELTKMAGSSYQDKVAEGIAEGIIKAVNKVDLPD